MNLKKIAGNIKTISYANSQGVEEHIQAWLKYYQDIGITITKEEIRTLLDLANKYNLFIISDETYRGLCFDHKKSYSLLHLAPGAGFYATPEKGKQEIRVAYVLNEEKLKRAAELLAMAVKKYLHAKKI